MCNQFIFKQQKRFLDINMCLYPIFKKRTVRSMLFIGDKISMEIEF